ncbi:MAG TPA: sucrose phosphorylase [Terriglobia bacterium]|nr:sucrose phosphorylase [Terriglobia bacterium]
MKNEVQLITYVDRLSGGGFRQLKTLFDGPFDGLFGGMHLLPFFWPIDGADAGFDPIDHTRPDPRLGSWEDVRALAAGKDLMADLIVNHVSSRSPRFEDFRKKGAASAYADLFLTYDRVFPNGATEADLLQIYRIRPSLPFTSVPLEDGSERLLWTSFTSEQIDIDVRSTAGKTYLEQILNQFAEAGVRVIRLDAAGFAIKKAGTTCFMIPETFEFIADLTAQAHARGIEALVEMHGHHDDQIQLARQVDWVYDFALPPLVLHALYTQDAGPLKRWLAISPRNAVTVLDTHDGIGAADAGPARKDDGVRPGLMTSDEIARLVETIHERSNGESRQASGAAAQNLDVSQVNCTFYDALGRRDRDYLIARALQFFAPGVPQVYYVGLLAGRNDMELLGRTSVGRDINRHYYTGEEIGLDIKRPIVARLFELIRLRNTHPAFAGEFHLPGDSGAATNHTIAMEWRNGSHRARLDVDLTAPAGAVEITMDGGTRRITLDTAGENVQ